MTDLKLEILEHISNCPRQETPLIDILNIDVSNCSKRYQAIKNLAESGHITRLPGEPDTYRLTRHGEDFYEKLVQERTQKMQVEKEKDFERKLKIVKTIASIISTIVTFATNKLDSIWYFFISLFK